MPPLELPLQPALPGPSLLPPLRQWRAQMGTPLLPWIPPPPAVGKEGKGRKKGKSPAWKAKPPVVMNVPPATALPSAAAPSLPAIPSTSSGGAHLSVPKGFTEVSATPLSTTLSSAPAISPTSICSDQGPLSTLIRKHGVCWRLVSTSAHMETYVRALMRVVGPVAIVVAFKMYGKVVFFLAWEAATHEALEKGRWVASTSPSNPWRTWVYR